MFRSINTFLSSLHGAGEDGFEFFLRKPIFAIGAQGDRVRGMFQGIALRQAVTIYAGVFWVIPITMVQPYVSLYMVDLGLSKTEVGAYPSLARMIGPLFLFLGGYLSDVWGRKKSLVLFDVLSWGGYCVALALASNKWWCVAAIFFMATNAGSTAPYQCLLVEGVKPKKRASVFTVLQMVNMGPALLFFPLLGGIWLSHQGLEKANHEMYWFFTACVALGIGLRWKILPESPLFEKSPRAWFHVFRDGLGQYRIAAGNFFKKPAASIFLFSKFLDEWILASWGVYSSLYYADTLGLRASYLSILAQVSSYIAVFALFLVIPNLSGKRMVKLLGLDQIFGLAALGLLLFLKQGGATVLLGCLLSASLGAVGNALYGSISAAVWMNIMGEKERAKVVAAYTAVIQLGLLSVAVAAFLYGHVSPGSLLWVMIGMRLLNFILLRKVAGTLAEK